MVILHQEKLQMSRTKHMQEDNNGPF